eukprot:535528-Amorphochlora_amoeboformis.AAC.1
MPSFVTTPRLSSLLFVLSIFLITYAILAFQRPTSFVKSHLAVRQGKIGGRTTRARIGRYRERYGDGRLRCQAKYENWANGRIRAIDE